MKKSVYILVITTVIITSVVQESCAQCTQPGNSSFWKIGTAYGSKLLSECHSSANYNCHGFVISYFEDGCTAPTWMGNTVPAPYTCPNSQGSPSYYSYQNQTNGKYIKVCNEDSGDIIYYSFDHSAVKEVLDAVLKDYKYLSKYGNDGPLVGHDRDGSWYHYNGASDNSPDYWVYIGPISGTTSIQGTSNVTFSVLDKPEVNYYWSVVSGYSNIYITSGSNQNSVTLRPTHSGTARLRLTASSSCSSSGKTQDIDLNIQTGICLEGTYDNGYVYNQNLHTANLVSVGGVAVKVTCPNATTFTWEKTSGNINGYFPPGDQVSFAMTAYGSISFRITAKNGSTTIGTRNVAFYNY